MTSINIIEQNTIVYIKMSAEDGCVYECVGALMEDTSAYVKIAFNAHNDVVKDNVIIEKKDILEFKIVDMVEEYK